MRHADLLRTDRGILERNAAAIESIFQKAGGKADGYKAKARKTNL